MRVEHYRRPTKSIKYAISLLLSLAIVILFYLFYLQDLSGENVTYQLDVDVTTDNIIVNTERNTPVGDDLPSNKKEIIADNFVAPLDAIMYNK